MESIIDTSKSSLTHRERFRRVMHFQSVDKITHWEFGYLDETLERWHKEGLPEWLMRGEGDLSVERYFGVESVAWIPVNLGIYPDFEGEVKVLEVKENSRIEQHPNGLIQEVQTKGIKTIPHYIKFPISNEDDWKKYKERLNPETPERNVYDYKLINENIRHSNIPVGIGMGSYYGVPRDWIGFEHIAMMLYDKPVLIEDIIETLTQLYEKQIEKALSEIEVDFAAGWEDIAFRNGPMISPSMFKSLVAPRIKRVCDLLRRHGVDVIWTDCDGNINDLVPIWLECGLNCMFPIEVQAGSDPVVLREKYGKQILLRGGLAKHEFSYGKKEIIKELKRVEKVVEEGGYIPHGDHRIPEDIPYENYKYYVKEKLSMLGWRQDEIKSIEPLSK